MTRSGYVYTDHTPPTGYNYVAAAQAFDEFHFLGGWKFTATGTLDPGSVYPASALTAWINAAVSTRTTALLPVFNMIPVGTAIAAMLASPTVTQQMYESVATVLNQFRSLVGPANAGLVKGASFDLENSTNLYAPGLAAWFAGLKAYLAAQGLPTYVANYMSPSYSASITSAVWQAIVDATDMTLFPSYIGSYDKVPMPQALTEIETVVSQLRSDQSPKLSFIMSFYSLKFYTTSTTPLSPNISLSGGAVLTEPTAVDTFGQVLLNAALPGAQSVYYAPFDCNVLTVPQTAAQVAAMIAAGTLPASVSGTQVYLMEYYETAATVASRIQELINDGWSNIAAYAVDYETPSPAPAGPSPYLSALVPFMLLDAIALRTTATATWVLTPSNLTKLDVQNNVLLTIPVSNGVGITLDANNNIYVMTTTTVTLYSDAGAVVNPPVQFSATFLDYDVSQGALFSCTGYTVNRLDPTTLAVLGTYSILNAVSAVTGFRAANGAFLVLESGGYVSAMLITDLFFIGRNVVFKLSVSSIGATGNGGMLIAISDTNGGYITLNIASGVSTAYSGRGPLYTLIDEHALYGPSCGLIRV